MRYRNPSSIVLFCLALLTSSRTVVSVGAPPQKGLPNAPEELVALMVGEDLHRSFQSRRTPNSVAANAARALMARGEAAVPALDKALDSKDPVQRLNIVLVLTSIDSPATVAPLIRAARDESLEVRTLAVRSLPVYSDAKAYQTALGALSDPTGDVQNAAIAAFAPPTLYSHSHAQPDNSVRFQVAQRIADLLKNAETRYMAAEVLGKLGSNVAVKPLLAAMIDDRPTVRSTIMESLGKLKDRNATVELLRFLKDADPNIRMYTATALGQLADMRATTGLIEALGDQKSYVRRDAATALGEIGDWRATVPLLALLDDPAVGLAAARALGQIGDRQAVDGLIKVLRLDKHRAEAAVTALGQLGDPRAAPHLGQYLSNHPESMAAAEALASIRHPDALAELARVASTVNSIVARRALDKVAGTSFAFSPPEEVAQWWKANRDFYVSPAGSGVGKP